MTTFLRVEGPFDRETAMRYRSRLIGLACRHPVVVVDLERVSRMDFAGVATLLESSGWIRQHGGDLWLINIPPRIRPILRLLDGSTRLAIVG